MTTAPPRQAPPRRLWWWGAAAIVATAAVLVAAVRFSGAAQPGGLGDPGAWVRWGLPVSVVVHHVTLSVTVASPLFALGIASGPDVDPRVPARLAAIARWAAIVWAVSAAAVLVFSCADTLGVPLTEGAAQAEVFAQYAWGTTPGRARLVVAVLAVAVAVLLALHRGRRTYLLPVSLAAAAVVPLSMDGHALSAPVPLAAVGLLAAHVLGVAVWVGGVIVLGLLARLLGTSSGRLPAWGLLAFRRFSLVAGLAYALVFASGVATAVLRMGSPGALATSYGLLVLLKTAAMLGLGVVGYRHRRWLSAAAASGTTPSAPVLRLVGVEVIVMGVALSLATALGRTMPPMPPM